MRAFKGEHITLTSNHHDKYAHHSFHFVDHVENKMLIKVKIANNMSHNWQTLKVCSRPIEP